MEPFIFKTFTPLERNGLIQYQCVPKFGKRKHMTQRDDSSKIFDVERLKELGMELGYLGRSRLWGRVPLRRGLPAPEAPTHSQLLSDEKEFYLNLLHRSLPENGHKVAQSRTVLDVGCRNWSYLWALSDFFKQAHFVGVEVDGGARYWNLFRRQDQALSNVFEYRKQTGRTAEFISKDFRELERETLALTDCVTFFYPFVSVNPCHEWGLPKRMSCLSEMIEILKANSQQPLSLISVHQGEWEARIVEKIYRDAKVPILHQSRLSTPQREFESFIYLSNLS